MEKLVERMISELSEETLWELREYCFGKDEELDDIDPLISALIRVFDEDIIIVNLLENAGIQ